MLKINNLSKTEISDEIINERNKEIDKISKDLTQLSDMQDIILRMTSEQDEYLDDINNNLEITNDKLNNGINLLDEATKYKNSSKYIMCGSFIGCAVGGPIGLIIGANPAILTISSLCLGGLIGYGCDKINI